MGSEGSKQGKGAATPWVLLVKLKVTAEQLTYSLLTADFLFIGSGIGLPWRVHPVFDFDQPAPGHGLALAYATLVTLQPPRVHSLLRFLVLSF